jgi:hypothetical protein
LILETIPYLMDKGRYYPLLTETQTLRLKEQIETLRIAAEEYDKEDLVPEATALRLQVKSAEQELDTNARLMSRSDVQTATVTSKEPTLEDFGTFQAALSDPSKAREKAVELLAPKIEGMAEIPLRFYPVVADACCLELNWSPSEERRRFLILSPSAP